MQRRILIGLVLLAVIVVAATFPLWRPAFVDDVVDEGFPEGFSTLPQEQQDVLRAMATENMEMAQETASSLLTPDTTVTEPMPDMPQVPVILAQGMFTVLDAVHGAEGTATIYDLPDSDEHVIRFENFSSTNGPDLHVILTRHPDPRTRADIGEDYVDLGQLKGNVGNQNYTVPADVNLADYQSVVIYCMPFHVVFSVATLAAPA